jgi:hypothetical protein
MSTTIEIPNEIWMLILDHLRLETQLDYREKLLNKKEQYLKVQNETLTQITNRLEDSLNETTLLIDNLNHIETNILEIINESNIEMTNEIKNTISFIDNSEL